MVVESIIFGGNKGVLQVFRDLVNINGQPVLIGVQRRNQLSLTVKNL